MDKTRLYRINLKSKSRKIEDVIKVFSVYEFNHDTNSCRCSNGKIEIVVGSIKMNIPKLVENDDRLMYYVVCRESDVNNMLYFVMHLLNDVEYKYCVKFDNIREVIVEAIKTNAFYGRPLNIINDFGYEYDDSNVLVTICIENNSGDIRLDGVVTYNKNIGDGVTLDGREFRLDFESSSMVSTFGFSGLSISAVTTYSNKVKIANELIKELEKYVTDNKLSDNYLEQLSALHKKIYENKDTVEENTQSVRSSDVENETMKLTEKEKDTLISLLKKEVKVSRRVLNEIKKEDKNYIFDGVVYSKSSAFELIDNAMELSESCEKLIKILSN